MATISSAPAPEMHQIDLSKLNIHQLAKLKQQLDQEINVFQDSLQTLKIAQGKFVESGESVEKITPESKGKTILVPLTGSMYVPGVIADSENVIIDIGTGYYAKKRIQTSTSYKVRLYLQIIQEPYWVAFKEICIEEIQQQLDNWSKYLDAVGDIEGAKDYFKRKVQFVTEQMEKIQVLGIEKSKARDAIMMMMEMKAQAQAQAQKSSTS